MKRFALLGLAAFIAFGTVGCNVSRITGHSRGYQPPPPPLAFALAVTVQGGLQPTAAQWAVIQGKMSQILAARGAILVTDISLADKILRLDFHPNPNDPEHSGHLTLLGVRTNPYYGTSRNGVLASAYSPGSSFSSSYLRTGYWGSMNYYGGDYYNYLGPWENGYTHGNTVVSTPRPTTPRPPHHHHGSRTGEICPPDTLAPRHSPGSSSTFASSFSTGSSMTPSYTSPEAPTRWTGERSAWRSELAANRSDRTYARSSTSSSGRSRSSSSSSSGSYSRSSSDRSYSRSDSSNDSWRSSREPTYNSPSYDYSSNSSSSSSSSSSMSAGSSHVSPTYTSPEPSSSSSSGSSGTLSTSP